MLLFSFLDILHMFSELLLMARILLFICSELTLQELYLGLTILSKPDLILELLLNDVELLLITFLESEIFRLELISLFLGVLQGLHDDQNFSSRDLHDALRI